MATPKATIWELEAHTRAKHEILRRYLQAWIPILIQGGFPEIRYIDGFAGPGEYSKGEQGSPIIALNTAIGYGPPLKATIRFLFVEKDKARADHLESVVDGLDLPTNFDVVAEGGITFEEAFELHFGHLAQSNHKLPPTFAFIDPFGWKGVPFEIVRKIMQRSSCEVFVNFMYEEINRFLSHPDQVENFDAYFGTAAWRPIIDIEKPEERNRQLHDLYVRQLKESAGAKYVRSFEMKNDKDVTDYFLFYATSNLTGLKKMKEAMWKIDEAGEFNFSDATDQNQLVLFEKSPDFSVLQNQILARFGGLPVTVGEIEEFVVVETPFRETHYKRQILVPLEKEGALTIMDVPIGRKKGTFADPNMVVLL